MNKFKNLFYNSNFILWFCFFIVSIAMIKLIIIVDNKSKQKQLDWDNCGYTQDLETCCRAAVSQNMSTTYCNQHDFIEYKMKHKVYPYN